MKLLKKNKKEKLRPIHDCPVFGEVTIVPRAFKKIYNTAYPDKIFYKCPFCGYED